MIGPNLSEWALRKRSLIVFLMIVAVVAGTLSFLRLGRAEDPVFTTRTMVVAAASWTVSQKAVASIVSSRAD